MPEIIQGDPDSNIQVLKPLPGEKRDATPTFQPIQALLNKIARLERDLSGLESRQSDLNDELTDLEARVTAARQAQIDALEPKIDLATRKRELNFALRDVSPDPGQDSYLIGEWHFALGRNVRAQLRRLELNAPDTPSGFTLELEAQITNGDVHVIERTDPDARNPYTDFGLSTVTDYALRVRMRLKGFSGETVDMIGVNSEFYIFREPQS